MTLHTAEHQGSHWHTSTRPKFCRIVACASTEGTALSMSNKLITPLAFVPSSSPPSIITTYRYKRKYRASLLCLYPVYCKWGLQERFCSWIRSDRRKPEFNPIISFTYWFTQRKRLLYLWLVQWTAKKTTHGDRSTGRQTQLHLTWEPNK